MIKVSTGLLEIEENGLISSTLTGNSKDVI